MSVDNLVKDIAPDPGPGMTPGAYELMREITALPRPARWRARRPWVALAAALAALLTWTLPLTGPAAAALDIRRDGAFYIVTVRDLFAEPEVYARQLREWGLRINLVVVPASPSRVGTIVPFDRRSIGIPLEEVAHRPDLVSAVQAPGECGRPGAFDCAIAVRIPVAYTGDATIILGRAARPGEDYQMPSPIEMPGELLQCVRVHGETVGVVRTLVTAHGGAVTSVVDITGGHAAVPDTWYVDEAYAVADRMVVIGALPSPPTPYDGDPTGCTPR